MIIGANTINNINNGAFTITHPTQTSLSIFNDGRLMLYNNRPASLNSTSLYLDYPLTPGTTTTGCATIDHNDAADCTPGQ
jgi:hypothetical protein